MFTGIIESLGTIDKIENINSSLKFEIFLESIIFDTIDIGDSLSINGTCLTVVKKTNRDDKKLLLFDIVGETISKTNFGILKINEKVNLETSLKLSDGLDGHIVQGHIDTTGLIISNKLINDNWILEIKINKKWLKYCIKKGSIAIDGISLTIAKINEDCSKNYGSISMSIIPHTLENTNLKYKKTNDTVNIETDFFAKYIEKLLPKDDK
jgi:riboflavin synthase